MPITPMKYIWLNGELVPWEKATVHRMTPALRVLRAGAALARSDDQRVGSLGCEN